MAQAYCFKCRGKREIKNAEQVFLKNNRSALKGVCPVCGGKLSRIGKGGNASSPKGEGSET